ncbi:MAG TPA: hemerythrin domain-containing protein [Chthonomonadaceae bacterium]|nr:hemerythrin domain-containing protein [Chthonomonadaceae bacterium]
MNEKYNPATSRPARGERPERAHISDRLGAEYEGKKTLSEVCAEMGLDREAVLHALLSDDLPSAGQQGTGRAGAAPEDLLAKLLTADHCLIQYELPRLARLIATLMQTRDNLYPDLWKLQEEFGRFQAGMESHMRREEQTLLFLRTQRWQAGVPTQFIEGTIEDILQGLEREHAIAIHAFEQMRALTDHFTPPEDACARYCALMEGLAELEWSVREHITLEKTILIPRARAIA